MSLLKPHIIGEMPLVRSFELGLMIALIVIVSLATYSRNIKWDNRYFMWNDVAMNSASKWRPHYRIGLIFHQSGRYGEALSSLERAYELNPDARGILNNMGLSLQRLGRTTDAAAMYVRAIEREGNPSFAYLNLGTLALAKGDTKTALLNFNSAIKADLTSVVALVNAGFIYGDMGNYNKAVELHERAVELNPYYANAHYGLAIAFEGTGDIDGALKEWRKYLKTGARSGQWRERALSNIERLRSLQVGARPGPGR